MMETPTQVVFDQPHIPYWLENVVKVSRSGYIQPCLMLSSLLWICFKLFKLSRSNSAKLKLYKPRGIEVYEILGQTLRGAAFASCIVASCRSYDQWPNASVLGYVFVLGIVRLPVRGQGRLLLLHQINAVSLITLTAMVAVDVLPLLIIGTTYRPELIRLAGIVSLFLALSIAALSPREWMPPREYSSLPNGLEAKPSKEDTCSGFDYWCTFGRVNPLIQKGWQKPISMSELEDLPWDYSPEVLRSKLAALRQKHKTTARALFMLLWPDLCYSMVFSALFFLAELTIPFGLYHLLEYLSRPEEAAFQPLVWLFVMFGGSIFGTVVQQQVAFKSGRATIKLKMALTAELYQRTMESREVEDDFLGSGSKSSNSHKSSTGQLTNLISTDIKALMDGRVLIMILFGGPVGCIIGVAGLYKIVGWPCSVGLAVMLLGSPVTAWIVSHVETQQEALKDAQDSRISLASEYLRSIKVIKYFGWEDTVVNLLNEARTKEQKHLWTISLLFTAITETAYCIPTISLLAIFGLYVGVGKQPLTASVAYTSISLLGIVRDNFTMMASMGMYIPKMAISLGRLDKFFAATNPMDVYPDGPLRIERAAFRRNKTVEFRLEDVIIDFVHGGLNVVTGLSGSGKTTLLLAILGETIKEAGHVTRPRDVTYASQSPWLQAQSIRDNILFNGLYDADRYRTIVEACCLDLDLEELPEGDKTDVGENGSVLSGGQRARVALARALYCKSSLLLLDDIFSAIDTKTVVTLWNRVFCTDLLKGRTVVLVTQLIWLPAEADLAIMLENGHVKSAEQNIGIVRKARIIQSEEEQEEIDNNSSDPKPISDPGNNRNGESDVTDTDDIDDDEETDIDQEVALTSISSRLSFFKYMLYFGGPIPIFLTISTLVLYNLTELATNFWMSRWVDTADQDNSEYSTAFYLGLYVAISLGSTLAEGIAFLSFMRGSWVAAKRLHSQLVSAVMNVSLSWFKENPVGRVINRLSGDMDSLDQNVAEPLTEFLDQVIKAILMLGAVTSILPVFIVPVAVLSLLGALIGEVYSRTIVFIKRLVSSSQSPVLSQFSESLEGMAVIRAQGDMPHVFGDKLHRLLYASAKASATQRDCDQWLKFRINFLAALINVSAGLLALSHRGSMSAGLVGFSLSQASEMSHAILRLVFEVNELNVEMQAFHRVAEYCKLAPEEEPVTEKSQDYVATYFDDVERTIPSDWPRSGRVEFRNVTVRYSPEGPNILKDISLTFNAGERVAIVGRTGSGKSTLVLSLLRFTHIVSGTILYDGVDITAIPRKKLRQAVATIPQEAHLFQGTIASNLDPTGSVPEPQLQKALDACASIAAMQSPSHLSSDMSSSGDDDVTSAPGAASETHFRGRLTLSTLVNTGGNNFSHGQRQVLSLCRILVRRSKLMLLDEATSSMDTETDAGIQQVLRGELDDAEGKERCLITIAHRLSTIADYDKVVVMGSGKVLEVGNPRDLWQKKGAFYEMVVHGRETSIFEELRQE